MLVEKSWKTLLSNNGYRLKLMAWNKSYVLSYQGILHIAEMVLSFICTYLIMLHCRPAYSDVMLGFAGTASETYFMMTSSICFAITSLHVVTCLASESSYILLSRTLLMFLSHTVMFMMSIVISGYLLFSVGLNDPLVHPVYGFNWKLTASVLGLGNSVLYLLSGCLAYHSCRTSWQ